MKIFNKTNITLILVLCISAILRFLCLDKAGGLWYDEIVSYKEASQPNILFLIFYTLKTDVHLPLYPLLLHFWGKLFMFSDYSLRAFSAVCGILTVISSFFIGKELKSNKTGLLCASVLAVNSFLIYYSQEVRMYSLLMLLASLYLLFTVRIKNNWTKKWNYVGLVSMALAIINTYTIGFIFVLAQFLSLTTYLVLTNKDNGRLILKNISISMTALAILCAPIFWYLLINQTNYTEQINGSYCDWSSLFIIAQNWFSPVLNGLDNNPMHYMNIIFSKFSMINIIFIFLPIAISLYSIFCALKKDKFSFVPFASALIFILSEIIAFKFTNFKILSRYTAIVLPNLLVLVGYGLGQIKLDKTAKTTIITAYIAINLLYLAIMNTSAFRMPRPGLKSLAEIINDSGIRQNDFIVVWNRTEILDKYIDKKLNVLSILKNFAYTSEVILENQNRLNKMQLDERKSILRPYFASNSIPHNTRYLMNTIYNHQKKGQKFIITTTQNFDDFTQKSFIDTVNDDEKYKNTPFNDLLTIKSLLGIKQICYQNFHFIKKEQKNGYVVIIFEK